MVSANAAFVDKSDAVTVAKSLIFSITNKELTVDNTALFIEKVDSTIVYYVINFIEGGWVIVSADDTADPIIGFSDKGKFTVENNPAHLVGWMDNFAKEISSSITKNKINAKRVMPNRKWKELIYGKIKRERTASNSFVLPMTTTKWNQSSYYNDFCPLDAPVGCLPLAIATTMKSNQHPSIGVGHSGDLDRRVDFETKKYNWNEMPDRLTEANSHTAEMLSDVGVAMSANYGARGTSAIIYSAASALKEHFNYKDSVENVFRSNYENDSEWIELLKNELLNKRTVVYVGTNRRGVGHALVCDGFRDNYFHFNVGWGGRNNGYYNLNRLTTYGFNNYQSMIIGIAPKGPNLKYPFKIGFEEELPVQFQFDESSSAVTNSEGFRSKSALELYNGSTVSLNINVPIGGVNLSFWVKKENCDVEVLIENETGGVIELNSNGIDGHIDLKWERYVYNLAHLEGTEVTLLINQQNSCKTYVDNIELTYGPVAYAPSSMGNIINLLLRQKKIIPDNG